MGGPRQAVDQRGIARIAAALDYLYRQASARPRSTLPNFRSTPPRQTWLSQPVDFLSELHIRLSWSCRPSVSNAFSGGMFHAHGHHECRTARFEGEDRLAQSKPG